MKQPFLTKCISNYFLATLFFTCVGYAPIQAEADVILINKPNNGISVNRTDSFQVGEDGTVFNNSISNTTTTIAGDISANPNLSGTPATLIIQEVTGSEPSYLKGNVEIAGDKAALLIANPNGLSINGTQFINTGEVSLVAGSIPDAMHPERVHLSNNILVENNGLQVVEGNLKLVANRIGINGNVQAQEIQAITANGELDWSHIPDIATTAQETTRSAIDIATRGGMYANTIYLQTTQADMGIYQRGKLQAIDSLTLRSNGDIVSRNTVSSDQVEITTPGNVDLANETRTVILSEKETPQGKIAVQPGKNNSLVVDIVAPDKHGISLNTVSAFHVNEPGVVLNNTLTPLESQIAGAISKNRNFTEKEANLIVIEVNTPQESTLVGPLEIAGKRASFLLANPNGIIFDGFTPINMNHASFITGAYQPQQGNNTSLYVEPQGTLTVTGRGIYGGGVNYTNLIGNQMQIWASVNGDIGSLNIGGWGSPANIQIQDIEPGTNLTIASPNAIEVQVQHPANGADILNISAPQGAGISYNRLRDFSVRREGLVLNNSLQDIATQLAGNVTKNPQLTSTAASLIIAEATGARSEIHGSIEVAGQTAGLILANPNGINYHDGKLINIDRATFLAGTIQWDQDRAILNPSQANVNVQGTWADLGVRQLNLVGNNVELTHSITTQNLNILIGKASIYNDNLQFTTKTPITNNSESFLTVDPNTTIQANRISIQSNTENIGLIQKGRIEASRSFRVGVKGNILQAGKISSPMVEIQTSGNLENRAIIHGEHIDISGNNIINLGGILGSKLSIQSARLENGDRVNPNTSSSVTVITEYNAVSLAEIDKTIKMTEEAIAQSEARIEEYREHLRKEGDPEWEELLQEEEESLNENKEFLKVNKEMREERSHTPFEQNKTSPKGSIIYGSHGIEIDANYIYNQENSVLHSDGNFSMYKKGSDGEKGRLNALINYGGTIYTVGGLDVLAHRVQNLNSNLAIRRVEGDWEKDPDRIEIDAPDSEYHHIIATKDYFDRLDGRHSYDYYPDKDTSKEPITLRNYWEIHSEHKNITNELMTSTPGEIIAEGNMVIDGNLENKDSMIQSQQDIYLLGNVENTATAVTNIVEHQGEISHAAPEQHFHHFHNKTTRRWTSYQPYIEDSERTSYYIPTVRYSVSQDIDNPYTGISLATQAALQSGVYKASKEGNNLRIDIQRSPAVETKTSSSLITAKQVFTNQHRDFTNEGTLSAENIVLNTNTFANKGRLLAKDITTLASGQYENTGDMIAENKLVAKGSTITITTPTIFSQLPETKNTERTGMVVTNDGGLLQIQSDTDLVVRNQHILHQGEKGKTILIAGQNLQFDVQTYHTHAGTTTTEDNVKNFTTDSGSIVEARGDIQLQSGRDMYIKATTIRSESGTLEILSGRDIQVTTGQNKMDGHFYWRHRNGGIGSKRGKFWASEENWERHPISTELLGDTVRLVAKRDVELLSSNTIDRQNTFIKAGRDITSSVDTVLRKTEYTKVFEGHGIGFHHGIRIGRWTEKHTSNITEETPVPTTITSTHGHVDLDAEGKVHLTTTYIYGKDGVTITGSSVVLDGTNTHSTYQQTDTSSFSGLQIGLGGHGVQKLQDAYVSTRNALRAKDKRLALLEGIEASSTLGFGKKNWKDYWNQQSNNAITLSVALAHEKSKQTYENIIVKFHGGYIASEGDITIKAKDIQNGEIKLIGQTLQGRNINLETYNLTVESGENTATSTTTSEAKEMHAGIEWGKAGAITPNGGFSLTNGEVREHTVTHTPTLIAGNHVTIHAGGHANIQGSAIRGKRVDMDVKGDLSIASDQESYSYLAKNSAIGANISTTGVSASASKGNTEYTLLTVKEQAGIFGGDEGINITVGGKTKLTGALIGSAADKEKNNITTGTLEMEDIVNTSKLEDSGIGAGYNHGAGVENKDKGLTPMIPIATNKEKKSVTYAAIVDGELVVTGDKDFKVEDVNRNTQDALNALENTLDLQEIAERKRMTELFGKYVNAEIHRISDANEWSDGDWQKIVLHAASGAIQGKLAGGSMSAGALTGAVNEAVNGAIAKYNAAHPDQKPLSSAAHQWLSAALGAVVGKAVGDTFGTGASIAASATKNNLSLDAHSIGVRSDVYKRRLDIADEAKDEINKRGNAYTGTEVQEAMERAKNQIDLGRIVGLDVASELFDMYFTGNYNRPNVTKVDETKRHHLPVLEFSQNSALNIKLRTNDVLNKRILTQALSSFPLDEHKVITVAQTISLYTMGLDELLGLGSATYIASYKRKGDMLEARITIFDVYDFDERESLIPGPTRDAYILQQSGRGHTFAYKTTYDVEVPLKDLVGFKGRLE